jgi:hypothetical protein
MMEREQSVLDFSAVRKQIDEYYKAASQEAPRLAEIDINSPEAIEATKKSVEWGDIRGKVDHLLRRAIELLPK